MNDQPQTTNYKPEIYLIRHTTPDVPKGVCYGQTDLAITNTFTEEVDIIRQYIPGNVASVHSSPLQRCSRLAAALFPTHPVTFHKELMEIHCGEWEMQRWDDLPKELIDPWMKDFVNLRIPGGESYLDLHERVTGCFNGIRSGSGITGPAPEDSSISGQHTILAASEALCSGSQLPDPDSAPAASMISDPGSARVLVAHGGVLRSILSYITGTPLIDSFKVFSLYYGCVIRLFGDPDALQYEILSNRAPEEKEQHKPRSFYKGTDEKQPSGDPK